MTTVFNKRARLFGTSGFAFGILLFAIPLFAQTDSGGISSNQGGVPAQDTYRNETQQVIHVLSTPVVPNAKPSIVKRLQPGESYSRARGMVGASVSFELANGGAVEHRFGPNHISLVVSGERPPVRKGITYVNRTGGDVKMFEQQGVSIPPRPPTYVRSLQANQSWTDGPTRVSPLSFQLASGIGQIRQVQEQTQNGPVTALVRSSGNADPGPANNVTTYVNNTGQDVQVYSQNAGAPGYRQSPQYETTIAVGGTYQQQVIPGSPSKSFRLASGGNVQQKSMGGNRVGLATAGIPTPNGNPNVTTYVNMTGQNIQVYSQMAGAPRYRQSPQYETTIAAGGTYQQQVNPGSPSKSFRLASGGNVQQKSTGGNRVELVTTAMPTPDGNSHTNHLHPNNGQWHTVPSNGQWHTVPSNGQWHTVPSNGQWHTVPNSGHSGQWQQTPSGGGIHNHLGNGFGG